jgi:hypothetical protein
MERDALTERFDSQPSIAVCVEAVVVCAGYVYGRPLRASQSMSSDTPPRGLLWGIGRRR